MLRPQFARQQYQDLDAFREHVDDLIASIKSSSQSLDLQPLFFRFTLDTTSAFLFGKSTYSLRANQSGEDLKFAAKFDIAQDFVVQRYRYLDLYWLIGGKRFREACASVHRFIENIIEERTKSNAPQEKTGRYVFIDAIAQDSQDRNSLRDQLVNVLLAGRDTTACLLSWTLWVFHSNMLVTTANEDRDTATSCHDIQRS